MKSDQLIRMLGIVAVVALLVARLVTVGNGQITVFGVQVTPFALAVLAVVVLALPELVDKFPIGPTRSK